MKNKWKTITIVSVTIMLFITVGTTLIIHSQKQEEQNNSTQTNQLTKEQQEILSRINERNKEVPVADLDEPLPSNRAERTAREKRNKARNIESDDPTEAERFKFSEKMESTYGSIPKHARVEPAIPAKQSDAIIVGEIADAKAYLSEDKGSVYSEFTVSNPETLKNITSESIGTEKSIIVSREGGGVRFSSGRIIFLYVTEKPMPRTGKKYIFFLKYFEDKGFSIITAYELKQEQVFPLDGLSSNGSIARQVAGYQSFKGVSETDFFNRVKEAIENKSDVIKKEE